MAVIIKSPSEIERMREAGALLAKTYDLLIPELKPGMSTWEIDAKGEEIMRSLGGIPSQKGYFGYPAAFCVSVNDEVVHGIPRKDHLIKEGDIVSLDTCLEYRGYQSDAARTVLIGAGDEKAEQLIAAAKGAFFEGIRFAKAGNHLNDISRAIQNYVESRGYGVVRDLVGHGIGANIHEDPEVPNFARKRRGVLLKPGMTLAIEPMITEGKYEVVWMDDEWTVVTWDGSRAAHYENTVLITEGEPEILTLTR